MSKSKFKKRLKVVTNVMKLNFFSNLFCIGKIFFIDILFEQQSLSELMHFRYYIFIYHKFDNSLLFRCKIAFLNYISILSSLGPYMYAVTTYACLKFMNFFIRAKIYGLAILYLWVIY